MEIDAQSPEPVVYSFIYIFQSPQLRSPSTKWVHTVTLHGAPRTEGLRTMGCDLVPQGDR